MPSSPNIVNLSAPLRLASFHREEVDKANRAAREEAVRKAGYQQGFADATAFMQQQLAEQRTEVIQLIEQTFKSLGDQQEELVRQVGALLPGLAVEIARRVLCGMEPDAERVERTVTDILSELAPNTRGVTVALNPADLALIGRYEENFQGSYPDLQFVADESLAVGDCRLQSSFGVVDGSVATKLENISRSFR